MDRRIFLISFFALTWFNAYSEKNVLLVNSYHPGFPWTDGITKGVEEVFADRADVNLYVEYQDAKRFTGQKNILNFKDYLVSKYNSVKIDLIITSDNNALDFIINSSFEKIWDVPVVFCGISNYRDYNIENKDYFGVLETDDWLPIVQTILKIHEFSIDTFYFVSEKSTTGRIRDSVLTECFKNEGISTKLELLENYTVPILVEKVSCLGGNNIIYYHGVGVDSYGNPVVPHDFGAMLAQHAHVPVYSSYPEVIGSGAIGGFVRSGRKHGMQTALIALKLLDGEDKSRVPKISEQDGEYIFDYKMAGKFHLNIQNFPQEARFINKPGKLFDEYKYETVAVIIFIIVLLIIITFLVISNFRRIRAEKKYKESESRFREFAELLPQIVFETDLNGRFLFVNNHAFEKFGYTKEDLNRGVNLMDIVVKEDIEKASTNIKKLIKKEKITDSIYMVRDKEGRQFIYEVHPNLILKDGKPFGIRGIGIDVTYKKQFEQELINAKKKAEESDRLKSAFLANMSHEIRTPLNSIVGFSYLMSERNLTEEEIKKMSKYIRSSSDHLLTLINDIIDISKIEAGQLEISINRVNVPEVLSELALYADREKERCEKHHIEIFYRNHADKENLVIETDVIRLRQVLYNLVNNAIKFTEKGFIEIGYQKKKSEIEFFVKDTGIGVSKEMGESIFNRFIKINSSDGKLYPGFGLGLSISRQLSELLGGKLWYQPNEDSGTTFFLSLPV
ncbi:MAG: PAS domain S-box protein [Bacteroidales bacterium]|nr:PAS domain S-box protein [Bacteroidales bacterium]